MTDPCQKEEIINALGEKLGEIQVKQAEIGGDISHIKSRIDNGMSRTISEIHAQLLELKPTIHHHSDIIKRIEDIGWWISKGLMLALLGVLAWAIAQGWKP